MKNLLNLYYFVICVLCAFCHVDAGGRTSSLNRKPEPEPEVEPPVVEERDTHASGCQYLGKFRPEPQRPGHGEERSDWGKTVYVGEFLNCSYHGVGVKIYANGRMYDGEWAFGQPHGMGKFQFNNGDVYQGQWEKGQFHGQGQLRYRDGASYTGEFKGGQRHGEGVFKLRDGHEYVGSWRDDRPQGVGKFTDARGVVTEGDFQRQYPFKRLLGQH